MKNFIEIYDNALTTEQCKYIIDFMNKDGVLIEGAVNKGKGAEVCKEDKDSWDIPMDIDNKKPDHLDPKHMDTYKKINKIIIDSLFKFLGKYKRTHPQIELISSWRLHERYNLQKYYPNQGFKKVHCEVMNQRASLRIGAWMFYLNDVDDGGTYFDNYDLSLEAKEGRLVVWPSYWTHCHRGIISKTKTKYIATGWLRFPQENIDLQPLNWMFGSY